MPANRELKLWILTAPPTRGWRPFSLNIYDGRKWLWLLLFAYNSFKKYRSNWKYQFDFEFSNVYSFVTHLAKCAKFNFGTMLAFNDPHTVCRSDHGRTRSQKYIRRVRASLYALDLSPWTYPFRFSTIVSIVEPLTRLLHSSGRSELSYDELRVWRVDRIVAVLSAIDFERNQMLKTRIPLSDYTIRVFVSGTRLRINETRTRWLPSNCTFPFPISHVEQSPNRWCDDPPRADHHTFGSSRLNKMLNGK